MLRRRFRKLAGTWVSPAPDLPRRALTVARWIFAPVAIAFLLYFAWSTRDSLFDVLKSSEPLQLSAAVLVWSLMYLLAPLLSTVIFRARGHAISYQTAAGVHITNVPARYVPGGIWHTVGRIAAFKRLGIGRLDIAVFVFLENVLAVSVAFLIGGSIVVWYHDVQGWGLVAMVGAAGGLVLLLASPFLLAHRIIKDETGFRFGNYLACVGVVALSWCAGAAAFVLYVAAFPELDLGMSALEAGGTYLFSWGVGFVAVFAPQGIGVFEVVASDLLGSAASLKSTAALLVGFRLVIMLSDALAWSVWQTLAAIWRHSDKANTDPESGV